MMDSATAKSIPIIRMGKTEDLAACAAIINDWLDATEWMPRLNTVAEIEDMFSPEMLKKRHFLVAECDAKIAGYLSMDKAEGEVHGFYLAPAFQCRGVGRTLMDVAKQTCPEGLVLTVFEANARARDFYAKQGFKEVPERRIENTDEGIPMLTLKWVPA